MAAILDWLNAHPALVSMAATTVLWPLLTAALSYGFDRLALWSPTTAALLRASGFDARRFVAILGDLARRKVPALPVPPEVIEGAARRTQEMATLTDADATPVTTHRESSR